MKIGWQLTKLLQ